MNTYVLSKDHLNKLAQGLLTSGYKVISPSKDGRRFVSISSVDDLVINPSLKPSAVSMKEFFFPKTETLFYYKRNKDEYDLVDAAEENNPQIILGAKSCDATAIPIVSKVFNWDYKDEFFNKKVENTIIVGLACKFADENCFCTSVGLSPVSEKGSDLFLILINENNFAFKVVTKKGEKFVVDHKNIFDEEIKSESINLSEIKIPEKRFESKEVKTWLDKNFNNKLWDELGENCLGCAQCAFACPTCHCFDIVDEECNHTCGRRAKNWDACQFEIFTKHASGHNPRNDQDKRYRQRISHKFKYYTDKFDEILCTGCGRCTRGCPVLTDIGIILEDINQLSKENISTN
jgi:ferredoxin